MAKVNSFPTLLKHLQKYLIEFITSISTGVWTRVDHADSAYAVSCDYAHMCFGYPHQTSYLSRISRIISVEKILSCGEISDFCKEFEQFMEFHRNLCRFCSKFVWRKICVEKISVEKKMTNMRSVLCIKEETFFLLEVDYLERPAT